MSEILYNHFLEFDYEENKFQTENTRIFRTVNILINTIFAAKDSLVPENKILQVTPSRISYIYRITQKSGQR